MKFKENDYLYYVNPFVFIIEKVQIDYAFKEEDGSIYYVDKSGANLAEWDLFKTLKDAQRDALAKLEKFFCECRYRILNDKPLFEE